MTTTEHTLLEKIYDAPHDIKSNEFRLWWINFYQEVTGFLNPDPWLNEPFTQQELKLFKNIKE